jgi:hypothetical protein
LLLVVIYSIGDAASPEDASGTHLHRDVDRNSDVRITVVEQVIAVIDVSDVDVVRVIPVIRPVAWPWIDDAEPIALVLEARVSTNHQEWESVDAEPVVPAEVSPEPVVRNAVAAIAAALLPGTVIGVPAL